MLFPEFAPHCEFSEDKKSINKHLKSTNCLLLRYVSDFDNPRESDFWYVIKDTFTPIEEFSKNTRNQVKKGLKNCYVKQVEETFFRTNCYEIYKASILSYGDSPISKTEFENASYLDTNRDFWIVFSSENDTPIAYSCNKVQNNSCNYAYIKYHPDFLPLYPSYALHYEMDKHYLEEKKMKYINMGAKTLYHETSVQDFIIKKFKYRKAYCKLNIIYRPGFGILVKTLFPLRKIIAKIPLKRLSKVNAILKQHEASLSF